MTSPGNPIDDFTSPVLEYEETPPTIIWEPNSRKQALALACPAWELLLHGNRGGGKTDTLLMDFAQDVGVGWGPAWRGILFRKTYKQLKDAIAKSKKWFPFIFPEARFNEGDYTWKFPDGEELILSYLEHKDDYMQYHGWELPWIGYDELTSWATSELYELMKACSRAPKAGMRRRIRASTNPWGAGHNWVKVHFDPQRSTEGQLIGETGLQRTHLQLMLQQNVVLMDADPDYERRLNAITDDNLRKAWLLGDWNVVAGGMFSDLWSDQHHVIPAFTIPKSWRIDRSFDWGSSAPFSVGWWAETDGTTVELASGEEVRYPRGSLIRVNEWYGWNGKPNEGLRMLNRNIAEGIIEREKAMGLYGRVKPGPADSAIYDVVNGRSISADFSDVGVLFKKANKGPGSRVTRWQYIRTLLANARQEQKEHPGLYVFERCIQFSRTIPILERDDKDWDDIDSDQEDHIADETGYRVLDLYLPPAKKVAISGV